MKPTSFSVLRWESLRVPRISSPPHSFSKRSCGFGGISSAFTGLTPSCLKAGPCFPTNSLPLGLKHLDLGFSLADGCSVSEELRVDGVVEARAGIVTAARPCFHDGSPPQFGQPADFVVGFRRMAGRGFNSFH